MKNESRTNKSIKNASWGMINQLIGLITSFIIRTIFIKTLGVELLGLNGLYSNILSILSLAELGFGSSMLYSLYKPIAENDNNQISKLMNFYKKTYHILALVIFILGICLIPFLKYIINLDIEINNYVIYYVLFLLSTVSSYLLVYKSILIDANQKMHLIQKTRIITTFAKSILQIIILLFYKNYLLFLIVQILSVLIGNIYISHLANKQYKFNKSAKLSKDTKKDIFDNIKSLFLYKMGSVILNNTDNILISIIVGTLYVGYYSNYLMIVASLTNIAGVLFQALGAGIGNLNNTETKDQQRSVLDELIFGTNWIFGLLSICLFFLFNDFITLWIGKEMIFSTSIVLIIVINFYIPNIMRPVALYRDTIGLFKKTKYVYMITALINAVLSVVLGIYWGILGILLATIIARILTNLWYEPYIIYKDYFNSSSKNYYIKQLIHLGIITVIGFIIYFINSLLFNQLTWINFVFKGIITVVIFNIIYILVFIKTKEFKRLFDRIKYIIKK